MSAATKDLWTLTWGRPQVDPDALAQAVETQCALDNLDFRTRLLIRDSVEALRQHWGEQRLRQWLDKSPRRKLIQQVLDSDLGPVGFPTLASRLMKPVDSEVVLELLRYLGNHVQTRTRLVIGGSIALMLRGLLSRATEDIDVVDELPPEIRNQHELLADIARRFVLQLAHFQSHYLPTAWQNRLRSFGTFGQLEVHLVDAYDVALSKLFSARDKDLDDLRTMKPQLDKLKLTERMLQFCAQLLAEAALRKNAEQNWYVLYGETLPAAPLNPAT
jgi:hypothetical protein